MRINISLNQYYIDMGQQSSFSMLVSLMNFVLSLLLETWSRNKYFQFYFSINLTLMEISKSLVLMPNQRSVFSFVQQDWKNACFIIFPNISYWWTYTLILTFDMFLANDCKSKCCQETWYTKACLSNCYTLTHSINQQVTKFAYILRLAYTHLSHTANLKK